MAMGRRLMQCINGIATVRTHWMQAPSPAPGSGEPGHMTVKTPCGAAACYDRSCKMYKTIMSVNSNLPLPLYTSSHAAWMVSKAPS